MGKVEPPDLRPNSKFKTVEDYAVSVKKLLSRVAKKRPNQVRSIDDAIKVANTLERLARGARRLTAEDAIVLEERLEVLTSVLELKINGIFASKSRRIGKGSALANYLLGAHRFVGKFRENSKSDSGGAGNAPFGACKEIGAQLIFDKFSRVGQTCPNHRCREEIGQGARRAA